MENRPTRKTALNGGNAVLGPAALALLIWAGSLKETPILSWLPVDGTLASALLVAIAVIDSRFRGGKATGRVAAPLLVFGLLFLPAALIAPMHTPYAVSKVVTLFTITLLIAVAPFYLLRAQRQRKVFLITLVLIGVVAGALLAFSPENVVNSPGRVVLEGSNTIATSRIVMTAALILLIGATTRGQRALRRLVIALAAVTLCAVALTTGSRGPVLAMAVAVAVVVVAAAVYRKYRARAIVGIGIVAALAAWLVTSGQDNAGFDRIIDSFIGGNGSALDGRVLIFARAIEMTKESVFGRGWGGFDEGSTPYPHNVLLEIGAEAGVIVLAVVIILSVMTLIRGLRDAHGWQSTAMVALFIYAFMNAGVSSDINGNRLLIVAAFALWAQGSDDRVTSRQHRTLARYRRAGLPLNRT